MPTFRYKAITAEGKPANGVVDAEDLARAKDRLQNRGLRNVNVMPAVLPGKKRSYVYEAPKGRTPMLILVLLAFLIVALGALVWFDPYEWFGLFQR
jgi:type II secretory pathway component PulF